MLHDMFDERHRDSSTAVRYAIPIPRVLRRSSLFTPGGDPSLRRDAAAPRSGFGGAPHSGAARRRFAALLARSACLAIAGIVWLAAPRARAQPLPAPNASAEQAAWAASLDEAERAEPAQAAAHVLDAILTDTWVERDEALAAYAERAPRLPRLARELLTYRALRRAAGAGHLDAVRALEAELGFVTQWRLIGPFPNEGMAGLDARYPPETEGVTEGTAEGSNGPVAWRTLTRASETGYVDLSQLVRPAHNVVAYLAADVRVSRSTDAILGLAVDGAYRVWLDGEPIAAQDRHLGGYAVRDEVPIRLTRGTHQLLVKIAVADTAFGAHVRWLDERGRALDVEVTPAERTGVVAQAPDSWPSPSTPAQRLGDAQDPDARIAAALVAGQLQGADPSEPWRALLSNATPSDAETRRWALRVPQPEWQRSALFADARAAGDESAMDRVARLRWQDAQIALGVRMETVDELRAWLESGSAPASAHALYYEIAEALGFEELAGAGRAALDAAAGAPEALTWARIDAASALERDEELVQLYRRVLTDQIAAYRVAGRLVAQLRARGEHDEADQWIDRLHASLPHHAGVARLAAEDARNRGRIGEAIAILSDALARCPDHVGLLEARARLHLESGHAEDAATDLERWLVIAPQDSGARDLLERVRDDDGDRFAAWRVDVPTLLAWAEPLRDDPEDAYDIVARQRVVRVHENGLATAWHQLAWLPHTRSGADAIRRFPVHYTPDAEVVTIRRVLTVAPDGTTAEVYDEYDFNPQSGPQAMYFDVRTRALDVGELDAGDLLVLEYEVEDVAYRNLFDDYFGDLWVVGDSAPTRYLRYAVDHPESRVLWDNRADVEVGVWSESTEDARRTVIFEAESLPRTRMESGAPGWSEQLGYVSMSTYETWDALADWYWQLVDDQLVTSPEIDRVVAELVEGLSTTEERVAAIYGYVVRNTRYVGLEFGIHGYKPYRTTECFERRFGDCKDTASLIKVMLERAGIDARLVLVRTSDMGEVSGAPPSLAYFNHAIAYVPALDLYLDGTAGFSGSTELPTGDQGASALIVDDGAGGRFVRIPTLPASASTAASRSQIDLRTPEHLASVSLEYSGAFAPGARRQFESGQQNVSMLEDELGSRIAGVEVLEVHVSDVTDIEEPVRVDVVASWAGWDPLENGRATLHPLGTDMRLTRRFAGAAEREHELVLGHRFRLIEEHEYLLPASWGAERLPENASAESAFGRWSVEREWSDGRMWTRAQIEIDVDRVSVSDYSAFRAFLSDAEEAMNQRVVFRAGDDA